SFCRRGIGRGAGERKVAPGTRSQLPRGVTMSNRMLPRAALPACALLLMGVLVKSAGIAYGQSGGASDLPSDIPGDRKFAQSPEEYDFTKRDVMIPMRDGVKLHTIILVPKNAQHAPMLLTRTPYGAAKAISRNESTHLAATLPG